MTMHNLKKIKTVEWKNIPIPLLEAVEIITKEIMALSVALNTNSGQIR